MRIQIRGAPLIIGRVCIALLIGFFFAALPLYLMEPSETSALLSIMFFIIGIGLGIYTVLCFWNK